MEEPLPTEVEHKDIQTQTSTGEGGIHIPHSFEVANETELNALTPGALDINKLIYRTDNEWYYRIKNNDPYVYQQITGGEFPNSVGEQTELTGVVSLEDIVSLNTDVSLIDIVSFPYWIQGKKYFYAGGTGIEPTIATGDSSTFVGADSSGIIYSDTEFTEEETLTILPLARLQTVSGTGQGSDLQTPIHLTYTIAQEGHERRAWLAGVIGVLYQDGGLYSENETTPLQVDQEIGKFHSAQGTHVDFDQSFNIEASSIYNQGGNEIPHPKTTLVIPKYWDNGTNRVVLQANKFVSHTLLRSPKEEDLFFLVYGKKEYDSQQEAQDAQADYSIFSDQATAGLITVARFIIRGDSTNIEAIMDERPSIILQKQNKGIASKSPSHASMYISTPAETTITTISTYTKVAGVTTEEAGTADITVDVQNRFTYTGTTARQFKAEVVTSVTSADNNQIVRAAFAINGETEIPSIQEKLGVGTRVGNISLSSMPTLNQDDYIEFFISNETSTGNITVDFMNMNMLAVD